MESKKNCVIRGQTAYFSASVVIAIVLYNIYAVGIYCNIMYKINLLILKYVSTPTRSFNVSQGFCYTLRVYECRNDFGCVCFFINRLWLLGPRTACSRYLCDTSIVGTSTISVATRDSDTDYDMLIRPTPFVESSLV